MRRDIRVSYLRMKRAIRLYFPEQKLQMWALAVNAPACAAARAIDRQLFANDEEPKLPLAACDAKECICSYIAVDPRPPELRAAIGAQRADALKEYWEASAKLLAASEAQKESH